MQKARVAPNCLRRFAVQDFAIRCLQKTKGEKMEKIASFTIDHLKLERGLYVSRKDEQNGVTVTTFDLRMTVPNKEPVMDNPALHTVEHLGATFLRNCANKNQVVYFGPMGCRTGFYLVMFGNLQSDDVFALVQEMCNFVLQFQGDVPGATPSECGNFSEQNLAMAKWYVARYLDDLQRHKRFQYPV